MFSFQNPFLPEYFERDIALSLTVLKIDVRNLERKSLVSLIPSKSMVIGSAYTFNPKTVKLRFLSV